MKVMKAQRKSQRKHEKMNEKATRRKTKREGGAARYASAAKTCKNQKIMPMRRQTRRLAESKNQRHLPRSAKNINDDCNEKTSIYRRRLQ